MTARIVIVDDDPDTCSLLESFVRGEGYEAVSAVGGKEALLLLEAVSVDLILLDAIMPDIDGFETCRQIKALRGAEHVPVIFMTGLSETEHVVQGLAAGGVDYVTKPLAFEELAARIRVHLEISRATRNAMSALASVGSRLVSCDDNGRIVWATPEAELLLDELDLGSTEALRDLLRNLARNGGKGPSRLVCRAETLSLALIQASQSGQHLFRLVRTTEGNETGLLQKVFMLTPREADVLLWTAHGKSNKDMSEILNISARTVNKHLEQIFLKIGVENRASAASAATRILVEARN